MYSLVCRHYYSLEEYVELEKICEERLEYFDGNIWSMAGASPTHEEFVANIITECKNKMRDKSYRVFGSNLRVKVPVYKPYRYPDMTALCGEAVFEDFHGLEVLTNPALIVEILPPLTESFDLGDKFTRYKSIDSFTEYLLVYQDRPCLVLYTKRDAKMWLQQVFNSLDETVPLTSLDCELSVAEIYSNIEFPEPARPRHPFEREDFR